MSGLQPSADGYLTEDEVITFPAPGGVVWRGSGLARRKCGLSFGNESLMDRVRTPPWEAAERKVHSAWTGPFQSGT